jgi:hypothetical protein
MKPPAPSSKCPSKPQKEKNYENIFCFKFAVLPLRVPRTPTQRKKTHTQASQHAATHAPAQHAQAPTTFSTSRCTSTFSTGRRTTSSARAVPHHVQHGQPHQDVIALEDIRPAAGHISSRRKPNRMFHPPGQTRGGSDPLSSHGRRLLPRYHCAQPAAPALTQENNWIKHMPKSGLP